MSENEKFEVSSEWSAEAQIDADKYNEWYENSLNNNEEFWSEHGKRIDWIKPYTKVKDVSYIKIISQSSGTTTVHSTHQATVLIDI